MSAKRMRAIDLEQIELPHEFESWDQCRDYYAMEAVFLGQKWERNKTRHNSLRAAR